MEHKILWFDDEHESYEIFKNRAKNNGLDITAVKTSFDGIELLMNGTLSFEAIILDGLFFKAPGDNLDDVKKQAFGEVMRYLNENKKKNYTPCFVYSGQTSFTKDENELLEHYKSDYAGSKMVYDKLDPEDENLLFNDVLKAVQEIESTKVKMEFSKAFQIFNNSYLDRGTEKLLIDFLLKINGSEESEQPKNEFNKLRKIIENLVDETKNKGLLPKEIGTANLTRAIYFLCGSDSDYKLLYNYFHPTVNFLLPVLTNILQDGSHSKEGMRYRANDFAFTRDNGYLFKSCLYQIFDVLISFNDLFQRKDKGELAGPLWRKIETENIYEGTLDQDIQGNYHCGEFILPFKSVDKKYIPGQKIRILVDDINININTKATYPRFAVRFETV